MVKFRTKYDEDYQDGLNYSFWTDVGEDENLVQHSMQAECDVNTIMARYQKTGELSHIAGMAGEYGDFYDVSDYKSGTERIMAAQSLFMELPSSIRDRFHNDPAKFIEFATDEKNIEELRSMGLAEPAPQKPEAPLTRKDFEELTKPKGAVKKDPNSGDQ